VTKGHQKWGAERIYGQLREDIMNLVLYPGSRVTESELAARFGVSRTPIREALQRLSVEGYLTIRPKHGCFIRNLDVFELAEYYDVRVGLELEAVALLGKRVPYREVAALAELWDPERLHFGDQGTDTLKDAEEDFHVQLAELSGNAVLVRYLKDVNSHIRIIRRLGFPDRDSVVSTYQEHFDICQRLLQDDIEGARELLRTHIHVSQGKGREVTLAQLEAHRRRAFR